MPHVLYCHQSYPAQFGPVSRELVRLGYDVTFASTQPGGDDDGIRNIRYTPAPTGNAHYLARTFDGQVSHAQGVFDAVHKSDVDRPDLIVGHCGLGGTLFLRELWHDVPLLLLSEYYYRPHNSDVDFRTDLNWPIDADRYNRCRAAMRCYPRYVCHGVILHFMVKTWTQVMPSVSAARSALCMPPAIERWEPNIVVADRNADRLELRIARRARPARAPNPRAPATGIN